MNNINQLAEDFVANDHFNADAIDNKRKSVAERFAALQEPLKAREEKLNDALKLQQYFRYSHMKIAGVVRLQNSTTKMINLISALVIYNETVSAYGH